MSVLETVKKKIGIEDEEPTHECRECGNEFRSDADPDSYWFQCPDCGSEDVAELN